MSETISKRAAEALFEKLHKQIANLEKTIIDIIERRAWEPLGYASFADAWQDRMSDVPLATQVMKAHVVYALLDTEDAESVADMACGVAINTVRVLERQKNRGIPPDLATIQPSRQSRSGNTRTKPHVVHAPVTVGEYSAWNDVAKSEGMPLSEYCTNVLRAHFEAVTNLRRRRRAA